MMRSRTLFGCCVAAISLLPVASAHAQVPPDFETRELSKSEMEFVRTAQPFADCLVAQNAKEIPKFLGSLSGQSAWLARDMRKSHPGCPAPKSMGKDEVLLLQGALLEALIRRDFGAAAPPPNFSHLPPFRYVRDTDSDWAKEYFANLIDPYDCVTRREPVKVHALLGTRPVSAEESIALADLRPTLAACHPKGEKWEMHAYFARRYLAETYYTLMKVNQRANAGTQN